MNIKIVLIILNTVLVAWIYINLNDQDKSYNIDSLMNMNDLNELHQLEIIKTGQNFKLIKEKYNWKIVEPIDWDIDEFAITNFTTVFSHLEFNKLFDYREITDRGEVLSDYGIDAKSIKLKLVKPNHTIIIKVGNTTRDNRFVFCEIQVEGNPNREVWRISNELLDIIDIPFHEWALNNLVRTNLHQVKEITSTIKLNKTNLNTTKLIKNDIGEWEFTHPFETKANNENVRLLLNRLLNIKVTDYNINKDTQKKSQSEFTDWKFKLELNSTNSTHEFLFSDTINSDTTSYYFCKSNYTDHVIKLDGSFKSILSDWTTKLRERKVFRLENDSIHKIIISNDGFNLKMTRSINDNWEIENNEDIAFEADDTKMQKFLLHLNSIKIKEFISFESSEKGFEFDLRSNSVYKIQTTNDNTVVKTILIQNNQLDATLSKILMVEESLLCLVEEDWSKILNINPYELKKRRILSEANPIKNLQIIDFDSNKSIYNSESNSTLGLLNEFESFEVEAFVNDKSSSDGTWLKGDWVPWAFILSIEYSNETNYDILLSEKLSEKQWLGSLINDTHTFNIPKSLIQKLSKIIK